MAIWILVSDASRATLYSTEKQGDDWVVVGMYQHPESRLKNSELSPTAPGHAAKSKGGARHTTLEPDTSPKEAEAEHFAKQLATVLSEGTNAHQFDGLVLVAPAHFLGLMRQRLCSETEKHLRKIVSKDYTSIDAREVRKRLEAIVFANSDHSA